MKKDLLQVIIPVQKQVELTEEFVMAFEKTSGGAALAIAADDVNLHYPSHFNLFQNVY